MSKPITFNGLAEAIGAADYLEHFQEKSDQGRMR